jgi:hypothetical protein
VLLLLLAVGLTAACGVSFGREYEYEEQLYLSVDGSASVVIDASIPALVALRGLPLDPSPRARFDSLALRHLYEAQGCDVLRVGSPWMRHGRRFVQVRLAAADVDTLGRCGPLSWSTYRFTRDGDTIDFRQRVSGVAAGDPGQPNWTGGELVAFRMHLPSKITYHNVRRLSDNSPGEADRGNILTWEQRLGDRRADKPIDMHVQMEAQSIFYRTLWLFAGSFLAAVVVLVALIWWTVRKGRRQARLAAASGASATTRP